MPVPIHIVTIPYRPLILLRPCNKVAVLIAPVAPKGCPRAIAPLRDLPYFEEDQVL